MSEFLIGFALGAVFSPALYLLLLVGQGWRSGGQYRR